LPSTIPEDEFEAFYDRVDDHRNKEVGIIREKLSEIAEAKAERERRKQEAEAAVSAINSDKSGGKMPAPIKNLRQNAEVVKLESQMIKELQEDENGLPDPEILKEWYKLDKNNIPPVYKLQHIR